MISNKEIRRIARERLSGNWLKMALVNIIVIALVGSGSYFTSRQDAVFTTLVLTIVSIILNTGLTNITLHIAKGKKWRTGEFFVGIKEYLRSLGYNVIIGLMVVLIEIPFLLLILTNAIASLVGMKDVSNLKVVLEEMHLENIAVALVLLVLLIFILILIDLLYSMVIYIILEKNPEIGLISSFKYSRQLMKGRKAKLFGLYLSFIGWGILSILSLGIGILFLNSYIMTSFGVFYLELLKDKEEFADEKGLVAHRDIEEVEENNSYDLEKVSDSESVTVDNTNDEEKNDSDDVKEISNKDVGEIDK